MWLLGKSETIEQIKVFGAAYIRDLVTVYDDMGVLSLDENGMIDLQVLKLEHLSDLMI